MTTFLASCFPDVGESGSGASGWASGTLHLMFWACLPELPDIVSEWASLVPLTVYLSDTRTAYDLAGEVSLRARLSLNLAPKLWELGCIAKLLRQREAFLDRSSAKGDPLRVYDVHWGSIFPCYNSAATASVGANAWRSLTPDRVVTIQDLDGRVQADVGRVVTDLARLCGIGGTSDLESLMKMAGRSQRLDVIHVSRTPLQPRGRGITCSLPQWLRRAKTPTYLIFAAVFGSILISLGCIGTGLLLFIGGISYLCLQQIDIRRPPEYLHDNQYARGCMLVAAHDNATHWTLYVGDRGTLGSLLNKPMVEIAETSAFIRCWLRFAENLQVLVVTYIAGQKGWDGLFFLLIIILCSLTRRQSCDKHAAAWLREHGITTTAIRCDFAGRSALLGAVQLLGEGGNTLWMDSVLAPVMRRHVWLQAAAAVKNQEKADRRIEGEFDSLKAHEKHWVRATTVQALAGYQLIHQRLTDIERAVCRESGERAWLHAKG